ncbi:U-box domain-containing protein 14-like [Juglans microcarpa x Juglans regia]|uniref:U-box domain-containing protein 14-like n=1 Tax=Juglans microcarpa x Juglans regia TaxID=2249226 RepID=UPI001B7E06D5|nr:U-box domain-containing protein 14-like [Juglans microcarpa x Juglans regia]
MAEYCYRNDVSSLVLDPHSTSPSVHFHLCTAFSGSSFRRKIFHAVSCGASSHHRRNHHDFTRSASDEPKPKAAAKRRSVNSEKFSDLLRMADLPEPETDAVKTKNGEALEELKRVVTELQAVDSVKRKAAASIARLRAKKDLEARVTLAILGAIPPLVGMLDSEDVETQIASLYALLNLGIGNDANKAAIVKAGGAHKMLKLIEFPTAPNPSVSEAVVANFLGLSALDSNKPVIGSSGAIPFLVKTLQNLDHRSCSLQSKQDALRALYNLLIFKSNVSIVLETNLIPFLLKTLDDMEVSERMLAILSNVVSTSEGRKAISTVADAFPILVDVLNWTDSPGCQEKASYILMVMAHKGNNSDRQAMTQAGIVSSLLELTLLGSPLAQKRASRILECLRVDKGKQVSENFGNSLGTGAAVSAPICGVSSSSSTNPVAGGPKECLEEKNSSEEKRAVKQLVQQSLLYNMRRIIKRANLPQDFVPSNHFKSLTSTSTSKSLPF